MAQVKFLKGNKTSLPSTGVDSDTLYVCEDTGEIYISVGSGVPLRRIGNGGFDPDTKFDKNGGALSGHVTLDNNVYIKGKEISGSIRTIGAMGSDNRIYFGDYTNELRLRSNVVPSVYHNSGWHQMWTQGNFDPNTKFDKSGGDITNNINVSGEVKTDAVEFTNESGNVGRIYQKNNDIDPYHYEPIDGPTPATLYRQELGIRAQTDSWGDNNDGSGFNLYGKNDPKHPGCSVFHNGGAAGFGMTEDRRVAFGTKVYTALDYTQMMLNNQAHKRWQWYINRNDPFKPIEETDDEYYDGITDRLMYGQVNILRPIDKPALYITGAGNTEGDIVAKEGEALQFGHWHPSDVGNEFKEAMKIDETHNVEVKNKLTTKSFIVGTDSDNNEGLEITTGGADNNAWSKVMHKEHHDAMYGFSTIYNGDVANAVENMASNTYAIRRYNNNAIGEDVLTIPRTTGVVDFKSIPTVNGDPIAKSTKGALDILHSGTAQVNTVTELQIGDVKHVTVNLRLDISAATTVGTIIAKIPDGYAMPGYTSYFPLIEGDGSDYMYASQHQCQVSTAGNIRVGAWSSGQLNINFSYTA